MSLDSRANLLPRVKGEPTLLLAAGISGFSALCYEIIWFRLLSNLCGSTALAAGTTSAFFLLGLALGAWWLGGAADRRTRPLNFYGLLELVLAAWGLALPPLLGALERLAAGSGTDSPVPLLLAGGLALLPPTIAMGGTLPVLCRFLTREAPSRTFARVYAVNTFGAAAGTLLSGFFLIPAIGHAGAAGVAIGGNLLSAALAWKVQRQAGPGEPAAVGSEEPAAGEKPAPILLAAIALCGGAALMAEILWIRLFPLYVGNTTHAFALVLSVFLLSLAGGGYLYGRYLSAGRQRETAPKFLLLAMAAGLLPTLFFFDLMVYPFYRTALVADGGWTHAMLLRFLLVAALVAPTALASGALFPALVGLSMTSAKRVGSRIGLQLSANTFGAVAGSLAALLLIPLSGTQGAFRVALAILAAAGCLLLARRGATRRFVAMGLAAVLMAGLLARPWNAQLMNTGVYIYAPLLKEEGGVAADLRRRRMLFVNEGRDATVAVFEDAASRHFTINGKVDGGTGDLPTQVLLGQIPMLLHPRPERVLVIGLGTGITLNETLRYPGTAADCVEIAPGVVAASRYFERENGRVLDRTEARLLIGDARRHLLTTKEGYDVMISEPSNPWQAGNSTLFTYDFYLRARRSLNPGGLFCQWLPIYDLPPDLLRSAIRTFLAAFPATAAFMVHGNDLVLVGAPEGDRIPLDLATMRHRWQAPGVAAAFGAIGVADPFDLVLRYFVGDSRLLDRVGGDAPLNREDHNRLEFHRFSPRQHQAENARNISGAMDAFGGGERLDSLRFSGGDAEARAARRELAERYHQRGRLREAKWILGEYSLDGAAGHAGRP